MSSACFDTNCCQIWAHLSSIKNLIKINKNYFKNCLNTSYSSSCQLWSCSFWQHQNEGIPFWVAQMSLILLQEESEDKGQQSLPGQELRWLLMRQNCQPRKSKQCSNVLKCFCIYRCQRVCGLGFFVFSCAVSYFRQSTVLLHSVWSFKVILPSFE